jgi:hypothetical protein
MLPFYRLCLLHLPPGADPNKPMKGEWMLEIDVQADDGFEEDGDAEPVPTEFRSPENCNTNLYLRAWYCTKDVSQNWYHDIWNEHDWPDEDNDILEHPDVNVNVISRRFELSELYDKNAIVAAVDDFKKMLTTRLGVQFTDDVDSGKRRKK